MAVAAPAQRAGRVRTLLPASWPLDAAFVAYPLWWLIGIGPFIWPIIGMAVLVRFAVANRERLVIPRGFGLWLLMVVWIVGSSLQLDDPRQLILFLYRLSIFVSAGIFFLYVYNSSPIMLPTRRVAGSIAVFWGFLVISGTLGVVLTDISIHSPIEAVLPQSLVGNEWLHDLVHIRFAQIHDFLGYPIPRPSAPFPYSNEWGSTLALSIPLVLLALSGPKGKGWRPLAGVLFAVSVVPLVISVNRGTWLALGVGLAYASIRLLRRGRPFSFFAILAVLMVLSVTLIVTPLGNVIVDRLDNPHSNEGRAELYEEALAYTAESPFLGHGAPQASRTAAGTSPAIGTHGLMWMLLVTSGVPALLFFLSWLAVALRKAVRVPGTVGTWAGMVIVMVAVMVPYYGLLPTQLHLVMVAAALLWRESRVRRVAAENGVPA